MILNNSPPNPIPSTTTNTASSFHQTNLAVPHYNPNPALLRPTNVNPLIRRTNNPSLVRPNNPSLMRTNNPSLNSLGKHLHSRELMRMKKNREMMIKKDILRQKSIVQRDRDIQECSKYKGVQFDKEASAWVRLHCFSNRRLVGGQELLVGTCFFF